MEKILEEQAYSDYLTLIQCGSDGMEGQVGRDQRHSQLAAREQHREVLYPAAIGKEFGLPRKPESDLIHSRFMDRPGHHGLDITAEGQGGAFLQGVEGSVGRLPSWLA